MLLPVVVRAYDAKIDGINYNFSGDEATVTSNFYNGFNFYSDNVIIPESVTYNEKTYIVTKVGDKAFYTATALTSITIPNSVTSIGELAFYGCTSLQSVSIGDGVTIIGNSAFAGCNRLTSISIPNSVTSIGQEAFESCSGLTSIVFSCNVTTLARGICQNCSSLTSVTIPNSVTNIGNAAFYDCSSLTSVTIGNCVTSIGNAAFFNCSDLTSVTIPNSITSIGGEAFLYCSGLISVTIPNSITSIGDRAFYDCGSLTQVRINKNVPLSIFSNSFNNRTTATLYVPYGSKSAYEAADYWNEFKEIIEMPNPNSITVGSSGYATFSSQNALDFSEVSDIKAYIASDFDPSTYTLTLTRITEAPAEEGLYIVGTPGTYVIDEKATDEVYSNLLKGVTYPTTISPTDEDYTNFILANGKHGVAFYTISEAGELAAGKAYLQLPTASVADVTDVKALNLIFNDDDEDGICSPTFTPSRNGEEIYNLQGQRVDKAQNGIFVVKQGSAKANGKKIFIK